MQTTSFVVAALVTVHVVLGQAQTPAPQAPAAPPVPGAMVTVVGCLTRQNVAPQRATAPPGATGTRFDTANLPTLVVTTLTMVSATCA